MIEWGLPHLSNGNWILPAHFRIVLNSSLLFIFHIQNLSSLPSKYTRFRSDHFSALPLLLPCSKPSSPLTGILPIGPGTFAFALLSSAYSQSSSQTDSLKIYANPVCSRLSHGFPSRSSQWPAGPCMIWPLNFLQQSSLIPLYSHWPSSQTHQAYLHLRAFALAVLSASNALSQISGLMFLLPNALLKYHFLSEPIPNHLT